MLAKLIGGKIRLAGGKLLKHDGWITTNPREKDFIEAGYKPVEDNRLEEKEGFYQVAEYTEEEDVFLNKVFEEYMESKTITGLLNEELKELIEEIKELKD